MKNISLVLNLYASDHNSKLPVVPQQGPYLGRWLFDLPRNVADDIRTDYQLESIYCPANTLRSKENKELEDYFVSHMSVNDIDDVDETTTGWAVTDYFWLLTFNADWREADVRNTSYNTIYPDDSRLAGRRIFIDKTSVPNASSRPMVVDLVFTHDADEPRDFSEIYGGRPEPFSSNHLDGSKAEGGNVLNADGSVEWRNLREMDKNYVAPNNNGAVQHYW
ncbi:hypothetical protein [Anaerohalosphaera lusitana]|nr:hypothetical protein [Anaerohalosphaera lusitana]